MSDDATCSKNVIKDDDNNNNNNNNNNNVTRIVMISSVIVNQERLTKEGLGADPPDLSSDVNIMLTPPYDGPCIDHHIVQLILLSVSYNIIVCVIRKRE
jgi:hypothetical protein